MASVWVGITVSGGWGAGAAPGTVAGTAVSLGTIWHPNKTRVQRNRGRSTLNLRICGSSPEKTISFDYICFFGKSKYIFGEKGNVDRYYLINIL